MFIRAENIVEEDGDKSSDSTERKTKKKMYQMKKKSKTESMTNYSARFS